MAVILLTHAPIAPQYAAVPGKLDLTANLTRIMLPFIPMVALSVVMMGMLNSLRRFFIPALSPAMFNVATIAAAFTLVPLMPRIRQRDKSLEDQLRRAASSIGLNCAEAAFSDPGNRRARLFTAAGSANETRHALRQAVAWRLVSAADAAQALFAQPAPPGGPTCTHRATDGTRSPSSTNSM